MIFSANDHVFIKVLRQEKGCRAKKLIMAFPNKLWTLKQIASKEGMKHGSGWTMSSLMEQSSSGVHVEHIEDILNIAFRHV